MLFLLWQLTMIATKHLTTAKPLPSTSHCLVFCFSLLVSPWCSSVSHFWLTRVGATGTPPCRRAHATALVLTIGMLIRAAFASVT